MLNMILPWWEFIVRAVVVYVFLLIALRLTGKRQVGQLSPFDLVLLLVLSNSVQNSMNGGDNSMVGGLVSATTLILLNFGISFVTFRSRKAETLIEGTPQVLVHNGKVNHKTMEKEKLTESELNSAMRHSGITKLEEVRFAVLENNGAITIIRK